jgi:hypothetical protein
MRLTVLAHLSVASSLRDFRFSFWPVVQAAGSSALFVSVCSLVAMIWAVSLIWDYRILWLNLSGGGNNVCFIRSEKWEKFIGIGL